MKSEMSVPPVRKSHIGNQPACLSRVYDDDTNIAVWRRELDRPLVSAVYRVLEKNPQVQFAAIVTPQSVGSTLKSQFGSCEHALSLSSDISKLVDMFCFLFDLPEAGLRIKVLSEAMCPRFHVDWVPCRLVTTYCGQGTEWVAQDHVDRSKLGKGSGGLPDEQSGIYQSLDQVNQLHAGDVALLKGEHWHNNTDGGIVHRSPKSDINEKRLLVTLDF